VCSGGVCCCRRVKGLLGPLTLRRLKTQIRNGKPIVSLPKRDVFVESIRLSDEERSTYNAMQTQGKLIISKLVTFTALILSLLLPEFYLFFCTVFFTSQSYEIGHFSTFFGVDVNSECFLVTSCNPVCGLQVLPTGHLVASLWRSAGSDDEAASALLSSISCC